MTNKSDRDELRSKVKDVFLQIDKNAQPMYELTVKAIVEDWDDERLRSETVKLLKNNLLDARKNYDYWTDKIMQLIEAEVDRARVEFAKAILYSPPMRDDRDYSGDNADEVSKAILVACAKSCNELRSDIRLVIKTKAAKGGEG